MDEHKFEKLKVDDKVSWIDGAGFEVVATITKIQREHSG
jgi:hypothetical protein